MSVEQLERRLVSRVWGRHDLPSWAGSSPVGSEPVGEIWFEKKDGSDQDLLVKFLFTAEDLSIQVHPDDAMARRKGLARGKEEAWLILDANPDSSIGLGLQCRISKERLKAALEDGSITGLISWKAVAAGDFFHTPAGTIHAIGAGLTVLEIQQNSDVTYRLHDYGRGRELHISEGIEAADPAPWQPICERLLLEEGRELLCAGGAFTLERWTGASSRTIRVPEGLSVTLVPLRGEARLEHELLSPGTVWTVSGNGRIDMTGEGAELVAAYSGSSVIETLLDRNAAA